jgi:predicted aspartyl protease
VNTTTGIARRIVSCALLAALAACGSSSIGAAPGAPTSPPGPVRSASIPLGQNTGSKPGYHLTISVGGGTARDMLLDTGSAGLWVYANAIGKSYRKTKYTVSNSYASGIVYTGIVVYTHVDFGNGIATGEVPVALVQSATCKPGEACPAQPGSTYCPAVKPGPNGGVECLEASRKLYGTFGADMTTIDVPNSTAPVDELYNVIFGIAQPWAHAFAVTPGALIVGERSTEGYATMPLTTLSAPKPLPNGARAWKRDVTLCYTVATLSNKCYDTLFDTGATDVGFQTGDALPTAPSKCGNRVAPGTPFSAATAGGTAVASFNAGNLANFNRIINEKTQKTPQVNTGMTLFNRNVIYYDAAKGIVSIQPLAKPVHVAQQGCGSSS